MIACFDEMSILARLGDFVRFDAFRFGAVISRNKCQGHKESKGVVDVKFHALLCVVSCAGIIKCRVFCKLYTLLPKYACQIYDKNLLDMIMSSNLS